MKCKVYGNKFYLNRTCYSFFNKSFETLLYKSIAKRGIKYQQFSPNANIQLKLDILLLNGRSFNSNKN